MDLNNLNWDSFYEMSDDDDGWHILYTNYITALHAVAPLITVNNVKKRKHWTTPNLLHLIRRRDNYKSTADEMLNNTSFKLYKVLKNKVKHETIKAKR